jgi:2-hydroxychromene-2-carboxylate isomerase
MSKLKASIGRTVSQLLTSTRLQDGRRSRFALRRKLTGQKPTVHFFLQADDPYSPLLASYLPTLQARYAIDFVTHPVSPPDAAAAPELALLQAWSARDAARLVTSLGIDAAQFTTPAFASAEQLAQGAALRKRMGHYLGATLYFEGEWYWGTDRLHYLEQRLTNAGLRIDPALPAVMFPPRALQFKPVNKPTANPPVIHFYCSLRSPYTYLAAKQVRQLAAHYGAELQIRFVLPMVMRGLPVPWPKRLYILRDTKREADRLGIPFGKIVDPVGKPVEDGLALLHAAIAQGKGSPLLEAFLEGVFANGVDASTAFGLEGIGLRAGLTARDMAGALKDESWRAVAEANRADMLSRGIWGVPSFRVNDMPVLWGQDRLWMLEEDLEFAMRQTQ